MKLKYKGIILFSTVALFMMVERVDCYATSAKLTVLIDPVPSLSFAELPQIKPAYLRKAEREAAKLERKKKKDYRKAIKENLERSMEIQTPEVRERMKLNRKEANRTARVKRKSNKARTKAAARKFR